MGYYKEFKKKVKDKVSQYFERWIEESEQSGGGNKVWDQFNSPFEGARDFCSWLEEALREGEEQEEENKEDDDPRKKDHNFLVKYHPVGMENKVSMGAHIRCPSSQHARVLFHREYPGNVIVDVIDITTAEDLADKD